MLKRISVQQLAVGMYLKEFCGSWMEHPFWRSSFVITDPRDIDSVRASSVKEVWIDCEKGLDVAGDDPVVSVAESEAQVDAELGGIAHQNRETERVPSSEEFARAAKIVAKSRRPVTSMFEEARMGKAVDATGAQRLVEEISDSVSRRAPTRRGSPRPRRRPARLPPPLLRPLPPRRRSLKLRRNRSAFDSFRLR